VHPYVVLDVFTDAPLEGNQLAVFTEAADLSAELMQKVAREMNLSETVFLVEPDGDVQADARLRIFTPVTELSFAGHPTLGSAFVLGRRTGSNQVRLQTGAGVISLSLRREGGEIVYGEMEQPIPEAEPFPEAEALLAALGVERAELPIELYRNGPPFVYVALPSEQAVAAVRPDIRALEALGEIGVNCFAVTGARVKTRMFGPALGVIEDPATGSAAGPLAVHLVRHGRVQYGDAIEISQGAEIGRPSVLRARVEGASQRIEHVLVGGSAVLVARGEYRLQ
jgi:trans-2,3-dihydro-3-hydroxyanthranilate isomerase